MYIFAVFVIAGFLGVISEIRGMRKRIEERGRNIEQALAEIRDSLKPKS
jgi:hypothetical protein